MLPFGFGSTLTIIILYLPSHISVNGDPNPSRYSAYVRLKFTDPSCRWRITFIEMTNCLETIIHVSQVIKENVSKHIYSMLSWSYHRQCHKIRSIPQHWSTSIVYSSNLVWLPCNFKLFEGSFKISQDFNKWYRLYCPHWQFTINIRDSHEQYCTGLQI